MKGRTWRQSIHGVLLVCNRTMLLIWRIGRMDCGLSSLTSILVSVLPRPPVPRHISLHNPIIANNNSNNSSPHGLTHTKVGPKSTLAGCCTFQPLFIIYFTRSPPPISLLIIAPNSLYRGITFYTWHDTSHTLHLDDSENCEKGKR